MESYKGDMRLGKQYKWEDIEVNEVFAIEGCWTVLCKTSSMSAMFLATDWNHSGYCDSMEHRDADVGKKLLISIDRGEFIPKKSPFYPLYAIYPHAFYRLPEEVQAHWRTE